MMVGNTNPNNNEDYARDDKDDCDDDGAVKTSVNQ